MMGGQCSKTKSVNPPSPPLHGSSDSQFMAELSSYEAACGLDPDLKSFDINLHERTSRVINTLSTGVEGNSLSFDSLKEVIESLLEMNQDAASVILECKEDIWNNRDLFGLVKEYFENSVNILDFCTALDNCLKRARHSQLIIKLAVKKFEEEVELQCGADEKRYVKTMEELNRFKEAGNPFTDEFFALFQSVNKQQMSMLRKLQKRKSKLDKKLKNMKTWRRVSNVLFVSVFVSVLIFSVVAAAIAAPPVVTALAAAMAVPIGSVGKWCDSLWKRWENEVKKENELLASIYVNTYIQIQDVESINALVNNLKIGIDSFMYNVDFALKEEDVLKLAIDEIKKKLDKFMENIEDLGGHADKCSRDIRQARTVISRKIVKYLDK
ncbi:hypothetical protein Ddye_010341 [Dipteronia dyeriana]|uniref:Uncharacterized protein n=1 Tax=Dipteronia dyeriana TaxID=168575 RepID=A0AAD9XD40_9ROSI|nr:hypothetical protein Ddye_010341 [Dipteronia dyeriana]